MLVDNKGFSSEETDYDYLFEFFDDEQMLYDFCEYLDGMKIKIDLNTHKRIMCQRRLIKGSTTREIATALNMKMGTVQKIRRRMIDRNLVAYSAIADKGDRK